MMIMEGVTFSQSIFSKKYIWKVLMFFIMFTSWLKAGAQIMPIGNHEKDTVITACNWNNELYYLTGNVYGNWIVPESPGIFKLKKWDGKNLQLVTTLTIPIYLNKGFWISKMIGYKNKLYVIGTFDTITNVPNVKDILEWDGKIFRGISATINTAGGKYFDSWYFDDALIHNNQLFFQGVFLEDGAQRTAEQVIWDGKKVINFKYSSTQFAKYASINDTLYKLNHKFSFLDSTGWREISSPISSSHFDYYSILTSYKKHPAIVFLDTVYTWDGKNWSTLSAGLNEIGWSVSEVISLEEFNNELWATVNLYKGGTNIISLIKWNGKKWSHVPAIINPAIKLYVVTTENDLFVYVDSEEMNGKKFQRIGRVITHGHIAGRVFMDKNANCIYDSSDVPQSNTLIHSLPGNEYINTNDSGEYRIYADTGTIKLKVIPKKYYHATCLGTDSHVTITAVKDSLYADINFSIAPIADVQDIRLTLSGSTGWRARQGFTENYTLCYENVGTTKASGQIGLTLDAAFTSFSATPSPKSYTFPFAEWEFDSLDVGEKRCITFKARLDSATIKDSVELSAYFFGGDGWVDSTFHDNIDTLKQKVVSAVDPNDKTASPDGNITLHTNELRYHIRFQNTGTDTAYRIVVTDTLDDHLPVTGISINTASHPYKLDIKDNVLKWTFNNIMLPDSNVNEPLSHGFINYTAQIKPGLAIGTEIKNTAYIYFDYQKPVITNIARNKVVKEPVGIRQEKITFGNTLNIYPNPAASKVYLKNTGSLKKQTVIYNSLGQQIQTFVLLPLDITEWDVNHLPNGLYFIQAEGEQTHKLLIQH